MKSRFLDFVHFLYLASFLVTFIIKDCMVLPFFLLLFVCWWDLL